MTITYAARTYPNPNGVQTLFSLPFPYIDKTHVHVYISGVEQLSGFTFSTPTTILFTVAPPAGIGNLAFIRITPSDALLSTIQTGSIDPTDINLDNTQLLYLTQEAEDATTYLQAQIPGYLTGLVTASATGFYATTAALLAVFLVAQVLPNGMTVLTGARTTPGDNGGGTFRYDNTDVASADNGGNIRVDAAGRRWKAITPFFVPAALFGASSGVADNTTSLNNAFIAAKALVKPVGLQGANLKVNGTLNIDLGYTWLLGQGGTLDFTGYSTTVAINVTSTWTASGNTQISVHRTHPIRDVRIIGPGTGSQKCFSGSPATIAGVPYLAGLLFENVTLESFAVGWDITDGMCFCTWRGCSLTGHSYTMFRSVGNSNSGENMLLDNCYAIAAANFYLEELNNSNMDMTLLNCSIDGCDSGFGANTLAGLVSGAITGGVNGTYRIIGGHWETFAGNLRAVWVGGNGHFIVEGLTWVNTLNWNISPLQCDSTGLTGGLVLRDVNFNASLWGLPGNIFCTGTGRFVISGGGENGLTNVDMFSNVNNRQADYIFSGVGQTWWSGGLATDAGDKPAGATASIVLPAATSTTFITPCLPGQVIQALVQLKYAWTSGNITMSVKYCDRGATALQTDSRVIGFALAAYTGVDLTASTPAPPGTEVAEVTLVASAGTQTSRFGLPRVVVR